MRYEFRLPDIGEGLTEATIESWSVKVGDRVAEDDLLCAIETDKALVEITSPCSGEIVQLHGEPGQTLAVGAVMTVFETQQVPIGAPRSGDGPTTKSDSDGRRASHTAAKVAQPSSAPVSFQAFPREIRATPATRRTAREQGVDLTSIIGTGPGGRIVQKDVELASSDRSDADVGGSVAQRFVVAPVPSEPGQTRIPFSGLRKAVADQMVRSVGLIPHAASAYRCEAGKFVELRKTLQERLGVRISFTAMIMRAMIPALQKYPMFNYSVDDTTNEIVAPPSINIGFAAHTDDGLIVPVVKQCEQKSLAEIAGEIDRLAELARTRKIAREDLRGGTITLSNVGSHGRVETTGGRLIINHPQVAIIGISRIRPFPVIRDGAVMAAPCLDINTSYDHRVIDGIYANLFIERLVDVIEEPGIMLAY